MGSEGDVSLPLSVSVARLPCDCCILFGMVLIVVLTKVLLGVLEVTIVVVLASIMLLLGTKGTSAR